MTRGSGGSEETGSPEAEPPEAGSPAVLDHLVHATPDLDRTLAEIAALTGVRPVPGGSHPGRGTLPHGLKGRGGAPLHLLGLGGGAYFEIIGPGPEQPAPDRPRWFGVDALTGPRLVTWAVRVTGIAARGAAARAHGYDPGTPVAMSRRTPDGGRLAWQLTPPGTGTGLAPFLLDRGGTPHPSGSALPVLPLVSLTASHPDPGAARAEPAALGVRWPGEPVTTGPTGLTAVLEGRHGRVAFGRGAVAV
ncbi:VOC family protein [Streptomyces decoyicus]|uniref:VOC family protein n=1 Tax=Streptomyces decoyicus TaxID=249567 RepID=UPI002E174E17